MANFQIGDLISFSYPAVHLQGTRAHDKYPQVLVLHQNWEGLVHGLNFNYLTEHEINTIRMILDPSFEMKYRDALSRENPNAYKELEKILTGEVEGVQGPHSRIAKITSPRAFYLNIVKPFVIVRGWDPYRLYRLDKMTNIRILQRASHMTGADALNQFKEKQSAALQKIGAPKKGAFQWYKDKFQHARGPKLPRFRQLGEPHRPGALPGTEDEGGEEK